MSMMMMMMMDVSAGGAFSRGPRMQTRRRRRTRPAQHVDVVLQGASQLLHSRDIPVPLRPDSYVSALSSFCYTIVTAKKSSPYSITERKVPELIPVLLSQPAGDVSHKPGGRLPLFSTRLAVTLATLKTAATNFAAW